MVGTVVIDSAIRFFGEEAERAAFLKVKYYLTTVQHQRQTFDQHARSEKIFLRGFCISLSQ